MNPVTDDYVLGTRGTKPTRAGGFLIRELETKGAMTLGELVHALPGTPNMGVVKRLLKELERGGFVRIQTTSPVAVYSVREQNWEGC